MANLTLFVLRHAKSSWDNPAITDYERPLNSRGQKAAPRVGQFMREQMWIPDLIFSSTANRAKTTTELVVAAGDFAAEPVFDEQFYHAPAETYLQQIASCDSGEKILVVGHNPGLERLVYELTGDSVRMPTACLVNIHAEVASWPEFARQKHAEIGCVTLARELELE